MVLFAMKVGFSSALGAFVMGSIFAETLEAERIEKLVLPMKDIFGAIFFVSVGMMVDFDVILEYALPILILVVTVVVGQVSLAIIGLLLSGQNLKTTIQSSFCLTQIGEFAFIIAMLGANLGIIDEFIYPVIVAVSVITIFVTPYVMKLSDPVYEFLNRKLPESWKAQLENRGKWKADKAENVWNTLLLQVAKIVAVYSILSIAVLFLSLNYLKPLVLTYLPNVWGKLAVAAVTIVLVSPFLRAIVWKKNHSREYKYLWAKNYFNRIPLIVLVVVRFLGVFAIVAFVLMQIFNVHVGLAFLFACLLVFLMVSSKRLKLFSINLERKFQYNLNSRDYELSKKKEVDSKGRAVFASSLSSDVHLVDFTVSPNATCAGKSLCELNYRKKYGVHIVSILRGGYRINIPGGAEVLYPMDKVLALGTDEQLEVFQNTIQNVLEDCTYNECVSVKQFEVTKDSPFHGKTLRNSGVRDSQGCMIIRIDREGESIVNPDPDIVFTDNDVVWIVGENSALQNVVDDEKHNVRIVEEC
jgi:CPA2 family monovalent cation:H+ antiporter-2